MLDGQLGERGEEREQPLARRRARAERRRAPQDLLLERALVLVEQRERQPGPVAEAVEHRALGDAGGPRRPRPSSPPGRRARRTAAGRPPGPARGCARHPRARAGAARDRQR